jgi:hypothetical protein
VDEGKKLATRCQGPAGSGATPREARAPHAAAAPRAPLPAMVRPAPARRASRARRGRTESEARIALVRASERTLARLSRQHRGGRKMR